VASFSLSFTTSKAPNDAFAFLADMTNAVQWDPSIVSVVRHDDGDLGVGSSFEVTLGFLATKKTLVYTVTEYDPPTHVVLRAETSLLLSEDTITIAPHHEGSEITYRANLAGKGILGIVDPLLHLVIDAFGKSAAKGLVEKMVAS
jgi:Polyketide cyclase / dehydrase and lipid transport